MSRPSRKDPHTKRARITETDAAEMLRLRNSGGYLTGEIAGEFQCSAATVRRHVRRMILKSGATR